MKRHESYSARIPTPADHAAWKVEDEPTARPDPIVFSEVLYCKKDGIPWPCEVEQRDREIDRLRGVATDVMAWLDEHFAGSDVQSALRAALREEAVRTTVVLLPSVEEQREAGDRTIIDPAGVKIPREGMPVWANFQFNVPEDVMGYAFDIRLQDGRLVADVEMSPDATKVDKHFRFSIGGTVESSLYDTHGQEEVDSLDLLTVAIVPRVPHG